MPSYSLQASPRKDIYQHLYPITRHYARPWVAGIIMFLTIVIPCGLLAIALSLFPVKIEISLSSFEITDHITYLRREALQVVTEKFYRDFNTNQNKRSFVHSDNIRNQGSYRTETLNDLLLKRYTDDVRNKPYNLNMKNNIRFLPVNGARTREKRAVSTFKQFYATWVLELVYVARGGKDGGRNIFTPQRLLDIREIEQKIIHHPQFTKFCWRSYYSYSNPRLKNINYCMPLNSLTTYFFPSETKTGLYFDGQGQNLANINGTLRFILSKRESFWYFDSSRGVENGTQLLRAQVIFGTPIEGFSSPYDGYYKQRDQFKQFVVTYVDLLSKASTEQVRVLYGGPQIFDYEVESAYFNDIKLASISLALIFLVFLILSSSLFLTIIGLLTIVLSFPFAYFIHRVIAGIPTVGLLNGISLFVIIGIGVDDVFVFINTFRQTAHIEDLGRRLSFTVITAGKATLFTSFTTAVAFAANTLSEMPAVRDFGFFTSLLVIACWLTDILLMPSALCLWHLYIEDKECRLSRCFRSGLKCSRDFAVSCLPALPRDLQANLTDTSYKNTAVKGDSELSDSSKNCNGNVVTVGFYDISDGTQMKEIGPCARDDHKQIMEAIVQGNNVEGNSNNDSSHDDSLNDINDKQSCNIPELLQRFIYHYIAKGVIRVKKVIIVLFLVILVVSMSLVFSQLKTASKPPAFFGEGTNLQTLIDIRYNITSDSSLDCYRCSGIFIPPSMPKPITNPTSPTTPTLKLNTASTNPTQYVTTKEPSEATSSAIPTTNYNNSTIYINTDATTEIVNTTQIGNYNSTYNQTTVVLNVSTTVTSTTLPSQIPITTTSTTKPITTSTTPIHSTTTKPSQSQPSSATVTTPTRQPSVVSSPLPSIRLPTGTISKATNDPSINPCNSDCDPLVQPPAMDNTAIVNVVFGIIGLNKTNITITQAPNNNNNRGSIIYDPGFAISDNILSYDNLQPKTTEVINAMCRICKAIAKNTELVKPGGAHCFPDIVLEALEKYIKGDCLNLPKPNFFNVETPNTAIIGVSKDRTTIKWATMVFVSTTYKGQSAFRSHADFQKWEKLITKLKDDPNTPEGVQSMYQTSPYWPTVFIEVTAVSAAIYGVAVSFVLCVGSVAFFTGNFYLTLIVLVTITCVVFSVMCTFYLVGWELGIVEAISLSILVGTSVDYCAHLAEGYLIAGRRLPEGRTLNELRTWRTSSSMSHIGTSILSSAITTILATIPLCFTQVQLLAKFGQIVIMNTIYSILYTLTMCAALLSFIGPPKFIISLKASSLGLLIVLIIVGAIFLVLYIIHVAAHVNFVTPSGRALFP